MQAINVTVCFFIVHFKNELSKVHVLNSSKLLFLAST